MKRALLAFVSTLVVMWVVPIPFYAGFGAMGLVDLASSGPPQRYLLGVTIIKIGFAFGFVALYRMVQSSLMRPWFHYAVIWWSMFALLELGQVVTPGGNSLGFAVAGVLSEAVYLPLSAAIVARQLNDSKGG